MFSDMIYIFEINLDGPVFQKVILCSFFPIFRCKKIVILEMRDGAGVGPKCYFHQMAQHVS